MVHLVLAPWCAMVLFMVHHGAAGQVSGGEACGGDVVKLRITSRHPGGHSVHDNKQVLLPANAAKSKSQKLKISKSSPFSLSESGGKTSKSFSFVWTVDVFLEYQVTT